LIKGDRDALVQVLYNLIDNAIKFSGKSKHIDVSLVLKDNELHLSVKDFGIGISPADQEKVFERFYRCREPQEAGIRGSGIGLAIVKKIVEDHGGYLTLESTPGKGSNFTVRIPLGGN
jgi:two-component system sensor histidine kinase SenX3